MNAPWEGKRIRQMSIYLLSTFNVAGRHWDQSLTFFIPFKPLNIL